MPLETLLLDVTDHVALATINRPDKLNALNGTVIRELGELAGQVAGDDAIHGLILTGAGPKAFVAGADIGEIAEQGALDGAERARTGQAAFRRIEALRKPVIAAVNGFALGGGCELAMACHIRIASESAKFGQPEVKLGITPGYGGTVRLPRLVGRGRALELLLTGAPISAEEALRIGLVNRVVPADRLLAEATAMMGQILANGPLAVSACLDAVDRSLEMPPADALAYEASLFGLLSSSPEMREGTAAFLARRAPEFRR
ncbi:MAG TPA: enoyl-CoA hydratase-related protein [Gemmatimonadales bacterium]|jgi:enoyl-CoA hydratase|nr:enoyl-CoA hydratase-related protein [Gemmatimonadales bacterium]